MGFLTSLWWNGGTRFMWVFGVRSMSDGSAVKKLETLKTSCPLNWEETCGLGQPRRKCAVLNVN
jgi:hypothetical protein